ncbi:MAG: hypothetical protein VB081_11135 [Christensenella sp.]|uniref:hypothetical protein n=1 Tax=Christensenella sp. TaxID=1935934 RepID=UPI002B20565A|nr:hypothetical protein [Christensenella sp.]MEA5004042.1 hypothetical protein [Christensenella sp.]
MSETVEEMDFFTHITSLQIFALVLLAVGAVISFTAKRIARRFSYEHADVVWKFIGLGCAVTGFLLVFI